jgi:hypothetical protein
MFVCMCFRVSGYVCVQIKLHNKESMQNDKKLQPSLKQPRVMMIS